MAASRAIAAALWLCACSDRLELGSDLLWSADTESADLSQWAASDAEAVLVPDSGASVDVTSEQRHRGQHAIRLENPGDQDNEETGPEVLHVAGPLADAYYSSWFLLPEDYRLEPSMTLMQLRSRDAAGGEPFHGEQLRLRSLAAGGYVLLVFNNNANYLLEPVAEPAPHIAAGRWFHLETRYERHSGGRLRVWLDGVLSYDLEGRPGAAGAEVVLSVSNVVEQAAPAPLLLFVDDAAISLTRMTPSGHLSLD